MNHKVFDAVLSQNTALLEALLSQGTTPNFEIKKQGLCTPQVWSWAKTLPAHRTRKGFTIKVKSGMFTPLVVSCFRSHMLKSVDAALLLLAYGADPDLGTPGLALKAAAHFEAHHLVLELLARGADPSSLKPAELIQAVYTRPDRARALPRSVLPGLKGILSRALEKVSRQHSSLQLAFSEDTERMGASKERSELHSDDSRALLDCAALLVCLGADKHSIASCFRHHLEMLGF